LPARAAVAAQTTSSFKKVIRVRSLPTLSTITVTGSLPPGMTFVDNGNNTATLSGTPAAGVYVISVTATNGLGASATETITVRVHAPRT
jgi:hypothetical protein